MIDYQFGKHLNFNEVLKNKDYFAKIFSEGNPDLEKLLLDLWDREIETYMCCTGHEIGDAAYVMVYLPLDDKERMYNVISSVYNLTGVSTRIGREHQKDSILIDVKSYITDRFFRTINSNLDKNISKNEVDVEIYNIIEMLSKFNYENYDLYCEINNYDDCKTFNVYANYTTKNLEENTRHMYVLNRSVSRNEISENNIFFKNTELEQKVLEIDERNKQKQLVKRR